MILQAGMCLDTQNTCNSAHLKELHYTTTTTTRPACCTAAFTSLCQTDLAHAAFLECLSSQKSGEACAGSLKSARVMEHRSAKQYSRVKPSV